MAIGDADDRGGVHRAEPRAPHHRHAFLDRVHQRHQQPSRSTARGARRAHGARHRLPAGAVGPHQARRRRDALHRVRHGHARICRRCCPSSTSSSARSRNSTSPAAATTSCARCARCARARSAVLVVKRGPMGCAVIDGAIPRIARRRVQRQGRRRRRAERARRGRRVLVGLPVGLGARRGLRRVRALRQRLRRARGVAPRLRAGDADARRARLFPRERRADSASRPGCDADAAASRHRAAHAARRSARVRVRSSQSVLRSRAARRAPTKRACRG